ncbi:MAG: YfiR family protein [Nitrospirae bacterium]|nr:MAG: YfiR family protein [Nitrospirota bacterium]
MTSRGMQRILTSLLALAILCFLPFDLKAAPSVTSEYLIKAAFIFKFVNFVDWPEEKLPQGGDFNLCIIGKNPFEDALFAFDGKRIKRRVMRVWQIKTLKELKKCQILYIGPDEAEHVKGILKNINNRAVLTVGDSEGLSKEGVMINMITLNNRISFEINIASARKAGLRISSKLLNLAKRVYDEKRVSVRRVSEEPVN